MSEPVIEHLEKQLKTWQKILVFIISAITLGTLLAGAVVQIDSIYLHRSVFAAENRQLNKRLDQTDLSILEGQQRSVVSQIIELERRQSHNDKLTDTERAFLQRLHEDQTNLARKINDMQRRLRNGN